MNAFAVFVVNEHLEFLLNEAAQRRAMHAQKPSIRQRIVSAASALRASMATQPASPASSSR